MVEPTRLETPKATPFIAEVSMRSKSYLTRVLLPQTFPGHRQTQTDFASVADIVGLIEGSMEARLEMGSWK